MPAAPMKARRTAGDPAGQSGEARRKRFFLKKEAKTFCPLASPAPAESAKLSPKSFLFLFFKKEPLPFLHPIALLACG